MHSNRVRAGLPAMIPNIARLRVDERGYPVPWFVAWVDGKPEFRMMDSGKWRAAVQQGRCWVCGGPLDPTYSFVIGPMCAINRTTSEPPSHHDCARWSVQGCPFMTKPQMVRREDDFTREHENNVAGVGLKRNPGVSLIWETMHYEVFPDGKGGQLIKIGPALEVSWWREGRTATRAEIIESIDSGLPLLLAANPDPEDKSGEEEIRKRRRDLEMLLPPHEVVPV